MLLVFFCTQRENNLKNLFFAIWLLTLESLRTWIFIFKACQVFCYVFEIFKEVDEQLQGENLCFLFGNLNLFERKKNLQPESFPNCGRQQNVNNINCEIFDRAVKGILKTWPSSLFPFAELIKHFKNREIEKFLLQVKLHRHFFSSH